MPPKSDRHIWSPQRQASLLEAAKLAQDNAYTPYSHFRVGAALLTESGEIITGCNIENASYGLTICAERTAVARAIAEGHRRFLAIAIVSDRAKPCVPCGACRQFLSEFSPTLTVILENDEGGTLEMLISDLLPRAFGPSNLL